METPPRTFGTAHRAALLAGQTASRCRLYCKAARLRDSDAVAISGVTRAPTHRQQRVMLVSPPAGCLCEPTQHIRRISAAGFPRQRNGLGQTRRIRDGVPQGQQEGGSTWTRRATGVRALAPQGTPIRHHLARGLAVHGQHCPLRQVARKGIPQDRNAVRCPRLDRARTSPPPSPPPAAADHVRAKTPRNI